MEPTFSHPPQFATVSYVYCKVKVQNSTYCIEKILLPFDPITVIYEGQNSLAESHKSLPNNFAGIQFGPYIEVLLVPRYPNRKVV